MVSTKREKLKRAGHILGGLIILLHAYHRYEEGHTNYLFFLLAGLVFLSIAIFHHKLAHRFPWIDTFFFLIEAILSFIIAWEYFEAGKKGLPYSYLFAGLMQLFSIYMFRKNAGK